MTDQKLPSERSFGLLFVAVFALLAVNGLRKEWSLPVIALCAAVSVLLLAVTLLRPRSLAPLNKAWFKLGLLLGSIISPIVVGVIFFLMTPIAVVARLLGRDALRLKAAALDTYWIDRTPPGPAPDSFKNQF